LPPAATVAIDNFDNEDCGHAAMVSRITWQKVGRVKEPGRYMFTFGWLTVTADDLAIWQQYPEASFTMVEMRPGEDGTDEFHLGAFQLPLPTREATSSP
jgi:hypothetical protein